MRSAVCVLLSTGWLLTGAGAVPGDKAEAPHVCEVHDVPMERLVLPYRHGMIPMHASMDRDGEWALRMKRFPHPGDCIPATNIVLPGHEGSGVDDVCPVCVAARLAREAATGTAAPQAVKVAVSPELIRQAARELTRLEEAAKGDKAPEFPAASSQVAYCLLAGLAEQGTALEPLPAEEQAALGLTERGGQHGRAVSVTPEARVVLLELSVQDKAGTYLLKTATLYQLEEGRWVKKGKGAMVGPES